jgi:predicted Zn-dependent protease
LPLSGAMEFDVADVQDGFKDGSLLVTVTHEMGHVLGIGESLSALQ